MGHWGFPAGDAILSAELDSWIVQLWPAPLLSSTEMLRVCDLPPFPQSIMLQGLAKGVEIKCATLAPVLTDIDDAVQQPLFDKGD